VFNNYKFKVNSTAITNVDSFVPVVNRLNTASIKSFKLIQDIRIVTALPAIPDPTITYIVGAKDTVLISGLNGNEDMMYNIIADLVNPSSNDVPTLRINNIATSVYDYRYSVVGVASTVAANAQAAIQLAPSTGNNSINHINLTIDGTTGINRNIAGYVIRGGGSQNQIDANYVVAGNWRDSSTNITSFCLRYPTISGGYGVGTTIKVFALRP
jgi:hypothetical protein